MQALYERFLTCPGGISTDTRKLPQDCMFFALVGENFDGNRFAINALEAGAKYAVVSDPELTGDGIIHVDDTLEALQGLARYHRKELALPIVGITGSNGKTTTKELMAAVLASKFRVGWTQGNLNNHIGVPLTLLSFDENTELGIVEMGANHPGEIAELCEICLPDHGVVTNVGKAHIEGFGSLATIIDTKTALYRSVAKRGKGSIIYNADDPTLTSHIPESTPTVTYGQSGEEMLVGELITALPHLNFRVNTQGKTVEVNTSLFGGYNMLNALAAIATGMLFEVPLSDACQAIEEYVPNMNRSQVVDTGRNTLVLDAYNANPTSMSLALKEFKLMPGERIAILGDMLELGEDSMDEHKSMIELASECADETLFVGNEFKHASGNQNHNYFTDVKELKAHLSKHHLNGKTILIKGSRGIRLEEVVDEL